MIPAGAGYCQACGSLVNNQQSAYGMPVNGYAGAPVYGQQPVQNPDGGYAGAPVYGQQPAQNPDSGYAQDQVSGYVVPAGYMNIGNPMKKEKVSAYTQLPQRKGMLPFRSLFHAGNRDEMILGPDYAYYWISGKVIYAMTEDCVMGRVLSAEERQYIGNPVTPEENRYTFKNLIADEIRIGAEIDYPDGRKPPESDGRCTIVYEYQHIKKLKPLPAESSIKFKGMYGGTFAVPPKHFDFVLAYVSARV